MTTLFLGAGAFRARMNSVCVQYDPSHPRTISAAAATKCPSPFQMFHRQVLASPQLRSVLWDLTGPWDLRIHLRQDQGEDHQLEDPLGAKPQGDEKTHWLHPAPRSNMG